MNEKQFVATVDVAVSRQFMAWVIGLGDGAEIIGPESVVDEMRKEIKRLAGQYGRSEE